jgi:ABC-type branched-subunit amino acid transport system substrate-binding protein
VNPRSSMALVAVALLSVTACGARVDGALRRQAADAALGQGAVSSGSLAGTTTGSGTTGGGTGGGSTTGGAPATGTTGGTAAGTTGTTGAAATGTTGAPVAGGSSTGATAPTSAPAPVPPGGNGGATDVGVTATSITLGNVADLSGPVPGLFKGAVIGTQAYFAKVNNEGGVFGRQLKLAIGDGQLDCGQNKAQTQGLVPKVFAFVGSFSLYDDCGADVLSQHKDIPDVHGALGPKSQVLASNFSVAPLGKGWRTGPLAYFKAKFGARWGKIGSIYANVGTGPAIWANTARVIEATGGHVQRAIAYGATDTDFTSDVIQMRNAGVQLIYINTTDGATTARFVNAAKAQGVDWPIIFGGTAYDSNFLKQAGANAEGTYDDQQFAMFFNTDEASRIPAVAEFQKWTDLVAGKGETKDIFGVYGWSSAQLFVEALKKAGPKAKRADVMAALRSITSFDADGLLAPANPAGKKPATAWILTQVKNGKYVRVDTPATAYRNDGTYSTG